MKALVTGGCGFIGFEVCKKLIEIGYEVVVVDDLSTGSKDNKLSNIKYFHNSIHDTRCPPYYMSDYDYDYDVIFHLAAIPRVSYSVEQTLTTTQANVISTVRLLDCLRNKKNGKDTKFIYSSSSSIYGGADQLPTPEEIPADPMSLYAMQKWQGEEWCRVYSKIYGLNTVCLRYFNVFGPGSKYGGAYSTVLSAWLYYLYKDKSIVPYLEGDGTQTRDFCYIDNVVQANILAAESDQIFQGDAFNISHGSLISLSDCQTLLEKISGEKLPLEMRPPRVGDVKHTLANIDKARQVLGYDPDTDLESQMRKTADWYKNEYKV